MAIYTISNYSEQSIRQIWQLKKDSLVRFLNVTAPGDVNPIGFDALFTQTVQKTSHIVIDINTPLSVFKHLRKAHWVYLYLYKPGDLIKLTQLLIREGAREHLQQNIFSLPVILSLELQNLLQKDVFKRPLLVIDETEPALLNVSNIFKCRMPITVMINEETDASFIHSLATRHTVCFAPGAALSQQQAQALVGKRISINKHTSQQTLHKLSHNHNYTIQDSHDEEACQHYMDKVNTCSSKSIEFIYQHVDSKDLPLVVLNASSDSCIVNQLPRHSIVQINAETSANIICSIPTHCLIMLMDTTVLPSPLSQEIIITPYTPMEWLDNKYITNNNVTLSPMGEDILHRVSGLRLKRFSLAPGFSSHKQLENIHTCNYITVTPKDNGSVKQQNLKHIRATIVLDEGTIPTQKLLRALSKQQSLHSRNIPAELITHIEARLIIDNQTPADVVAECERLRKTISIHGRLSAPTLATIKYSIICVDAFTDPQTIASLHDPHHGSINQYTPENMLNIVTDTFQSVDIDVSYFPDCRSINAFPKPERCTVIVHDLDDRKIRHINTRFKIKVIADIKGLKSSLKYKRWREMSGLVYKRTLDITGTLNPDEMKALPLEVKLSLRRGAKLTIPKEQQRCYIIRWDTPKNLMSQFSSEHEVELIDFDLNARNQLPKEITYTITSQTDTTLLKQLVGITVRFRSDGGIICSQRSSTQERNNLIILTNTTFTQTDARRNIELYGTISTDLLGCTTLNLEKPSKKRVQPDNVDAKGSITGGQGPNAHNLFSNSSSNARKSRMKTR